MKSAFSSSGAGNHWLAPTRPNAFTPQQSESNTWRPCEAEIKQRKPNNSQCYHPDRATAKMHVLRPGSNTMVFGDGAFGRGSGLNRPEGGAPHGVHVLITTNTRELSPHPVRAQHEGGLLQGSRAPSPEPTLLVL